MAIVAPVALLLAGPWYIRNVVLTGNPLYPTEIKLLGATIFPGMMHVRRSDLLKTFLSARNVFTLGYYGMTVPIASIVIFGWSIAIGAAGRRMWRDPLTRTCLFGAPIGIAIFVFTAPYGEMRFAYPAIVLAMASITIPLLLAPFWLQLGIAAALAILAAATAFPPFIAYPLTGIAIGATMVAVAVDALDWLRSPLRASAPYIVVLAGLTLAMLTYVHWSAYVEGLEHDSPIAWSYPEPDAYGPIGEVWGFVRSEISRAATIAYANTYFTYPLMGFRYDHRVLHVPTSENLDDFRSLAPLDRPVTGEEIVSSVVKQMRKDPDRNRWLMRLRQSGAQYLVIAKQIPARGFETSTPPELNFVADDPRFRRVFDNDAGSVFEIKWQ
jgi:hypothetical protein